MIDYIILVNQKLTIRQNQGFKVEGMQLTIANDNQPFFILEKLSS